MKVSDHAIIRYAQRFHHIENINEEFIKIWINQNPDLYSRYKKEILEMWNNENKRFLVEGVFEKTKKNKNRYYASHDYSLVFITDINSEIIITIYNVDFQLHAENNAAIFKILLNDVNLLLQEQHHFLKEKSNLYKDIDDKKASIKREKAMLENRINLLTIDEKQLNLESEKIANQEKEFEAKIDFLYKKIIGQRI